MALEFTLTSAADPVSFRLSGPLTLGPRLLEFGRHVTTLLMSQKPAGVLLDLDQVDDIDSAGLGELVILYTTAGQQSSRLGLVRPPARVLRLLEATRLSGLLVTFENESDARAWIQG